MWLKSSDGRFGVLSPLLSTILSTVLNKHHDEWEGERALLSVRPVHDLGRFGVGGRIETNDETARPKGRRVGIWYALP